MRKIKISKENFYIFLIVFVSFIIRLYPINAQLPNIYWHDEKNYIETALRFGSGTFFPYQLSHAGFFYIVLFFEFIVFYLLGFMKGIFESGIDFYLYYLKDPSMFFLIGRFTVLMSSLVMIVFVYKSAKRLFGYNIAIIAAIFSSFSLISVQLSFFAHADMLAVSILMISFYYSIKGIQEGRNKLLYLSSFLIGLSAATKYHCVFGILFIISFYIYKKTINAISVKYFVHETFLILLFFILGLALGAPFIFINPAMFYRDTFLLMGQGNIIENPYRFPIIFHIKNHMRNAFGIFLEIIFIAGLVHGFLKRSKKIIFISIFPITFYCLFATSIGFCHHLLPILPFVSMIAAVFLKDITSTYRFRLQILMALFIIFPTLFDSIKFILLVKAPDTREIARNWIENNIDTNSKILEEGHVAKDPVLCPAITPDYKTIKRDIDYIKDKGGSCFSYNLMLKNFNQLYFKPYYEIYRQSYIAFYDEITHLNPDYIILSGFYDIDMRERNYLLPKDYYKNRLGIKEKIYSQYNKVYEIHPSRQFSLNYPMCMMNTDYRILRDIQVKEISKFINGPSIYIYQKKRI
jgi:hypothetical protein